MSTRYRRDYYLLGFHIIVRSRAGDASFGWAVWSTGRWSRHWAFDTWLGRRMLSIIWDRTWS